MTNIHPVQFADSLASNTKLREKFIQAYVDKTVDSMDVNDIIRSFADQLWDDIESDIRRNGADGAVEEAVFHFPDLMEQGVSVGDTVFVSNTGTLTTTKPTASTDLLQNIGIVLQTSGTNIQKMKVSAIDRTNDIPNLDSGKFFIGGTTGQVSACTLPTADGTNGQLLQTDGAGAVTFVDFSGSPWTTSGSDIYYTAGNVGVGTTTPSEPLHVSGTARIDGDLLIIDSGQSANDGILITSNPTAYVSEHSHVSVRIGRSAGQQLAASAQKNVAIGNSALERSTASYNIALGFRTAKGMNGGYNVAIGDFAGNQNFSPVTNPRNVILGYQAGQQSTSGDNVVIGYDSGRYTSFFPPFPLCRSCFLFPSFPSPCSQPFSFFSA